MTSQTMISFIQNFITLRPHSLCSRKLKRSTSSNPSLSSTTDLDVPMTDSDDDSTTTGDREEDITAFLALADDGETKRRKIIKGGGQAVNYGVVKCGRLSTIMEGDEERSPQRMRGKTKEEMADVDLVSTAEHARQASASASERGHKSRHERGPGFSTEEEIWTWRGPGIMQK
ncbi:hypothetical protein H2198_008792 [Neophaeococcomyces mojaviensis]|uniref:Uncharacterized protein n=1 Tax=Neophaeococcomyces mojaviensis TaxID=3383035 RepID=A0ACC2ZWA1_9EURO|nr:hypothetical protein H2198_008792 [Knufia sp. JES_112]